jgi:hypothetical protein
MKNNIIYLVTAILFLLSCSNNSNEKLRSNSESKVEKYSEVKATESETDYTAIGKKIATEAQSALAKNLAEAINKGGTEYAVEFCNSHANPITDSMSIVLKAGIKRVSDKNRNPANKANENELAQIEFLKNNQAKGIPPQPKLIELNGKIVGYYPIVTNTLCMQCHGKKQTEISVKTLRKIHKLYPTDEATGYGINEIRGLWVVTMNKN